MILRLYISGEGLEDEIDKFFNNKWVNYPELNDFEEILWKLTPLDYETDKTVYEFVEISELDTSKKQPSYPVEEIIELLYKLTHHAEGMYEDTEVEFVHIEIFDGKKWVGGNDHEQHWR